VESADVDETAAKKLLREKGATTAAAAEALAELKALRISRRFPEALVLGADQILDFETMWFDKPTTRSAARWQLSQLRGRLHTLVTGAVAVRDCERLWSHVDVARLTMREFSDGFLDSYLQTAGDAMFMSVGAYQLEGLGAQLFDRVEGDHFTILGLPLLPVLGFLRNEGLLKT
jgi:Nucleotide-binding protein implicated in inhibition of septum formation